MPSTPKLAIPYPALPDPADVPTDTGELATRIDDLAGTANGLARLGADGKVPTSQLPPAPSAIPPTLVDAKGDLLVGAADDTPARLPVGSPGQVLVVDPAAPNGVRWATPADIPAAIIDAKGDLIVGVSNDSPGRLPAGADGLVLQTDSAQPSGLKWGAPPAANGIPPGIVDAKGDLIGASANDVPARLAVGADGQTLIADAASPLGLKWAAAPSGLPPTTGHEGHWLKVVGGAAVWVNADYVPLSLVTAKGDLIAATGPGAPARLAVGSDGQALLADAASPGGVKWGAVAAGGGGGLDWEGAYAPATAYVKGDVVTYGGVVYGAVNDSTGQTPPPSSALAVGFTPLSLVTSLPASPFDGQEVVLVDSLTAPTFAWRLRYVATIADAYKWVCIGGGPATVASTTTETTVSATYVTIPNTPTLTLPRAGIWDVAIELFFVNSGSQGMLASYDVGATVASDNWGAGGFAGVLAGGGRVYRHTVTVAGAVLTAKFRSGTGTATAGARSLTATPVRLS